MKVFISWSGERSQAMAEQLREWLPLVLHFVEPWVSQSDIDAGGRWANEVAKELEASHFGIICVTSENIASPWILFEAGALSKSMQDGRVVPLLLDIDFQNITGPLSQFQAKKVENSGLWELVCSINRLEPQQVPDPRLKQLFEMAWPKLEGSLGQIPKAAKPHKQNRNQAEILEELVSGVRGLEGRIRDVVDETPRLRRRRRFHPMMYMELTRDFGVKPSDSIFYLIFGSQFKDELPFLYEFALDIHRASLEGNQKKILEAKERFANTLDALRSGPFLDMLGDKELFHSYREFERIFYEEIFDRDRQSNRNLGIHRRRTISRDTLEENKI